ncbi:hypothetical protein GCM10010387_11110 [Streptomyces inusitatus]|uniref:Peptidase M48 domain-containing protein n=1 Tax=Streptomyces inusitatus TaxID=68221 RepID=A0A918PSQ8_9ACTN|nr:M48 family metalloprotease [Streptomyces inusitatus]GGZ19959.1 hypothetical protein GCM10010387_11110 [Streptomyces inusitatus]
MTHPPAARPPSEPTPAHPAGPEPAYPRDVAATAPEPAYPTRSPEPEPEPSYPARTPEPAYPTMAPEQPTAAPQAPEYPARSPEPQTDPEPSYPAQSPEPAYPTAPPEPVCPTAPPDEPAAPQDPPPAPAPAPTAAAAPQRSEEPVEHPHHIPMEQRRVHLSAHQRGADATAVGSLLLHLPNFIGSLFVIALLSLFFRDFGFIFVLAWLLSGALIFHRPTESAIARRLLGLRHPTLQESARLEPVWREVTARAGVAGHNYELWVEDSDDLNAVAAAGHIVGVTRFALGQLPNGELAAVLAHELGHHVGGHSWSSLLGYWYALPGRIAWRVMRAVGRGVYKVSRVFSCLGVGLLVLVFGAFAIATISTLYGLPLLILAVPYALAAVSRRAELRADQHAAALGFAPMLASVLDRLHQADQQRAQVAMAYNGGVPLQEPSALSKLLSSHPDLHTRLHRLRPYLESSR